MRFNTDEINTRLKALPPVLKAIFGTVQLSELLRDIIKKHNLHIDQAGKLGDEINFTLLGFIKVTDFIRNLKAQLNLPDEKINAIAKDVNEKIFLPIRESLKKAEDVSSAESGKTQTQNEIHHPNLVTPLPSNGEALPLSESEEIKQRIAEQQAVKPVATPPPNLPTGAPAESSEPKEAHLGAELPSEEKKPTHIDPYREPID